MSDLNAPLARLLDRNPSVQLAYVDYDTRPPRLVIRATPKFNAQALDLPAELQHLPIHTAHSAKIRPLIAEPSQFAQSTSPWQQCQDPPIALGCQCQPAGASWVGTAGSLVTWQHGHQNHYGLLSNWHVFDPPADGLPRPIHQPDDAKPPIAHTVRGCEPSPAADNVVDAAIADCLIAGYHSTDGFVLTVGYPSHTPLKATVGAQAHKSGRSTQYTTARCVATGAAARVGYPWGDAIFVNQDVYSTPGDSFSAPGDSGSLILHSETNQPMSLLFAGDSNHTIANPIHDVLAALNVRFPSYALTTKDRAHAHPLLRHV